MAGIDDIAAERRRQIEQEGWSFGHDDEHADGSLALAAICYATPRLLYVRRDYANRIAFDDPWPRSWSEDYDKRYCVGECVKNPGNCVADPATYTDKERRDLLVKAGALIAAEIDRLDRAQAKKAA